MIVKKCLVILLGMALLMTIPGSSIADYEDVIYDDQGDVSHTTCMDPFGKEVEKPNVDILRVEMVGGHGTVTVSLTVAGQILEKQDDLEFVYQVYLLDQDGTLYWIQYDGNHCVLAVDGQDHDLDPVGIGTDTLSVTFSLAEVGEPANLDLRDAEAMKRYEDEDEIIHTFRDTATAEEEEEEGEFLPGNFQLEVDPDSGSPTLDVTISISAENTGYADGEVPLIIDGDEHMPLEIPADSQASDAFAYSFFDEGTFDIEFGDQTVTVNVEDDDTPPDDDDTPPDDDDTPPGDDTSPEDEDDDSPGFAVMLMGAASIFALLIYKKKRR